MVLSDREILKEMLEGRIVITPLLRATKQIGSSSIDIRLGNQFRYIKVVKQTHFDMSLELDAFRNEILRYSEVVHIDPMEAFILHPGDFVLGSTLEYIILPGDITGRLEGRSSWGRVGLQIHSTAGFVDPGFEGTLTFELNNMGKLPLPLYPGVRIGQLSFHRMTSEAVEPYTKKEGAKYAGETGTRNPMFYEDYEFRVVQRMLKEQRRLDL